MCQVTCDMSMGPSPHKIQVICELAIYQNELHQAGIASRWIQGDHELFIDLYNHLFESHGFDVLECLVELIFSGWLICNPFFCSSWAHQHSTLLPS